MSATAGSDATELVCEALGRQLAALSQAPLFGLAGSGNLELIAAFEQAGGRYVAACHEAGAVAMADGWAQTSRAVGLATLHHGPGVTNAITALVDAAKGRTPLLVIASETDRVGGHASQWIAHAETLAGLGVGLRVRRLSAGDVGGQLAAALREAAVDCRPVVLLAPLGVQLERVPVAPPPAAVAAASHAPAPDAPGADVEAAPPAVEPDAPAAPDAEAVAALAERLRSARRPVIVAGRGALLADAGGALRALGERLGAVLMTTAPAHGLFAGDRFCTGIAGGFASPLTTRLAGEADVVLAVGASLNAWTTCGGRLFARARVERVDLAGDAGAATVVGDARVVAERLVELLDQPADGGARFRSPALAEEIARFRRADALPTATEADGRVHPGHLCVALSERLADRWTLVLDSGHFMAWPSMLADVREPGALLFGQAFQAVGLGVARAIGAAVARPDRVTVAMVGDGGAMMSLLELDTAVRLGLPLLVVIYNDAAYGAEVHDFRPLGVAVGAARFPDRDLAALARTLGAEALTVASLAELAPLDAWLERPRGPLAIDAKVDDAADAAALLTPLGAAEWSPAPRPTPRTR